MGYGHYQIGSIAVRMLTFDDEPIDHEFWKSRLAEAFRLRSALQLTGREDNDIYRLVHGEGDRLPGLVVDIYGRTAVMQAHSVGMHVNREDDASRLDFPESNSIQTGVALQRIAECILMLGESRRVQHDEIIVVTSLLEEFERIFGKRLMTRIAREVEFCIGTGQVDGL